MQDTYSIQQMIFVITAKIITLLKMDSVLPAKLNIFSYAKNAILQTALNANKDIILLMQLVMGHASQLAKSAIVKLVA